jgi:catechol 2,3-dioxygenase-like lactoylglutathione lyase family enzyme
VQAQVQTIRAGIILAARDVFTLSNFYTEVLGFTASARFEDPPYVILEKQGMRLSLTQDGTVGDDLPDVTFRVPHSAQERSACLVLEVADCDAVRAELIGHNVNFRSDTFRPPWGGARFFVADPENNLIEIEELA